MNAVRSTAKSGRPPKVQAINNAFSERVNLAAENNPNFPPKYQGQYKHVVIEMEKRGQPVTLESVRKWFNGETLPTQNKMAILSDVLGVDYAWLSGGDTEKRAAQVRRAHSAQASASANILAGVIAFDGGHPAFPQDDDERAKREGIDLYAVIRGVNYAFQIASGEVVDGKKVFKLPSMRGTVIVIGVLRKPGNSFEFYELDTDLLEGGSRYSQGTSEITVDEDAEIRQISSFEQRI